MNKPFVTLLFTMLALANNSCQAFIEKKMVVGSIQFPKNVSLIESIPLYRGGTKIKSDIDPEGKRVTFSLSVNRHHNFFHVLIAEDFYAVTAEDNTIHHWKMRKNKPYKLYAIELLADASWRIKEQHLPARDLRIPDEAIKIRYNPSFVDRIAGGSEIELPKIFIKENVVALAGSKEKFHDKSIELLISSIDFDALHDTVKQTFKQDISLKTIVALDM